MEHFRGMLVDQGVRKQVIRQRAFVKSHSAIFNSCMEVYGMTAFGFVKSAPGLTFLSCTVLWDILIRSFQSLA